MIFELSSPVDLQVQAEAGASPSCSAFAAVNAAAAREARLADRFAQAVQIASCAVRAHPEDADAWYELGAAHAALDARDEARKAWLHALDLAPSYDDARLGLARLAWRDGDVARARGWLTSVSSARRADPETASLASALDEAERSAVDWRMGGEITRSTLSSNLSDWTGARVSLSRREGASSFGLAIEHDRRFDREDLYMELEATHQAAGLLWSLALGGAPDADFRAEQSIRIGLEREDEHWHVAGNLTHAEYAVGPVEKFDLRAGYDLSPVFRIQASAVLVRDEQGRTRGGYGLGARWRPLSGLTLDAGWSDAPESSDGMTVDVRSSSVGAAFSLSPELQVRIGFLAEKRAAYDRSETSVGLAKTF